MAIIRTLGLAAGAALSLAMPRGALAVEELAHYTAGLPDCLAAAQGPQAAQECIGQGAETCMETEEGGYSTLGMSQCTRAETAAWDRLLNDEYARAMETARALDTDEAVYFPEFARRAETLRNAQRAWIAFRDAECELEYAQWGSGSARQIAGTSCFLDKTARRTIELRFLWEGFE